MSRRLRCALLASTLGLIVSAVTPTLLAPSLPAAAAAVAQSGTTVLTAPIVQPGTAVAGSGAAHLSGTVKFVPAKEGRSVVIQRRAETGAWTTVTTKKQDPSGTVSFAGPAYTTTGSPYTYRGVAQAVRGLSGIAASAQSAGVWTSKFTDEFAFFDETKWQDRVSFADSRECASVGDPRVRSVSGGALRLRVMVDPDRVGEACSTPRGDLPYVLNGQVGTQHTGHAFTHGTFAARIKFPSQRGQHGAFWMQPMRKQCLGDPVTGGAEIDVVEFFGQGYPKGGLASRVYNYGLECSGMPFGGVIRKATDMLPKGDAWWQNYHVFSLEWTKDAYTFRVDGRTHWRTTDGVTSVDEYLILSMLSSDWERHQVGDLGDRPSGTMSVDWVRVWQK